MYSVYTALRRTVKVGSELRFPVVGLKLPPQHFKLKPIVVFTPSNLFLLKLGYVGGILVCPEAKKIYFDWFESDEFVNRSELWN